MYDQPGNERAESPIYNRRDATIALVCCDPCGLQHKGPCSPPQSFYSPCTLCVTCYCRSQRRMRMLSCGRSRGPRSSRGSLVAHKECRVDGGTAQVFLVQVAQDSIA